MRKILILILSLFLYQTGFSKSVTEGFEALKIYNYFEAKRIFEKNIKKCTSPCAFGLATIYYRGDNPFHQLDSAYKYVTIASNSFALTPEKLRLELEKYQFSELNILELKQNISSLFFVSVLKASTVESYQQFIDKHPWSNERFTAIHKRDSIAFQQAVQTNSIQAFKKFVAIYSESTYKSKAEFLIEQKTYIESIPNKSIEEYTRFIQNNPTSSFKEEAEKELFLMQTQTNTITSFHQFITNFPYNQYVAIAWKKLFQIYMYNYSENRIADFMKEYPEYPFKEDIERELNNTKVLVFPYKKNAHYGLMNIDGEIQTTPIYDWINPFKEGLAMASKNGKVGFIDKTNQTIIPFEYDEALDFEEGRAIVTKGKKSGIIDRSGNIIFEPVFQEIGLYSEGLVFAKKDSLFAYYDQYGKQVIQEPFTEAFSFQEGIAPVIIDENENYIDKFGNLLFPLIYERITQLSANLFVFQQGNYLGLISKDLITLQEPKYDEIRLLVENKIAFNLCGKIGYFDQFGNVVISPIFEVFPNFLKESAFKNGMAKAKFKNKFGVIDVNGKWLIPATYQNLGEISVLIPFYKDLLWGYINLQNKVVVTPMFDEVKAFENQYAIAGFSDKFGLINLKGTIIIPVEYENIKKLSDDLYACQINGKKKIISSSNEQISPTLYANIFNIDKDLLILVNDSSVHYYLISQKRLIRPKESE